MKKNKGFTLIELMVTIAVLAIITMMAAPSFGSLIESQNLKKTTQTLVGVLGQARAQAVLERRDITVVLAKSSSSDISVDSETELHWKPSGKAELTSSVTTITYNLTGALDDSATDVDFVICSKNLGLSRTITVSPMGTVQVATEGTC